MKCVVRYDVDGYDDVAGRVKGGWSLNAPALASGSFPVSKA